tara:strand:+ start:2282 stop:2833 length:552 start_codon:yes stop_codon:yes gene_type:complete
MSRSFRRLRIAHKALPKTDLTTMPKVGQIVDCDLSSSFMEASNHKLLVIRHSNLKSINLKKSRLISSKVIHSNMTEAQMDYSSVQNTTFFRANLSEANLECSSLKYSVFNQSDLSRVNLRWSNLDGVMFQKTNLQDVDLCNSNLESAKFVDCNLKGAVFNFHTKLPFSYEVAHKHGMVLKEEF